MMFVKTHTKESCVMKKQVFNPYLPNYEYLPDGEPRVFGNRLYIYGSHDRFGADYYCLNDYVTYSAPLNDLSDWRYEGVIYRKTQDPFNAEGKFSMFAPDVVQGPDGRYYLYYGMDFYSRISVAVADRPVGPFEFYGNVKHVDGELYGSDPICDPFQFDPAVLVDDDNRVYLYTGFGPGREVVENVKKMMGITLGDTGNYVVELDQDMLTIKTEPKQVIPNQWDSEGTGFEGHEFYEASSIRKFNGKYYFIYSSVLSHELAFAMSDKPTEGYVYGGSLHSNADLGVNGNQVAQAYWGNNHGSIVDINGIYYIFGHRQTNYSEFSRQGIAEVIQMNEKGLFEQAELTSCGLNGGPLRGLGTYSAAIACNLIGPKGAMKSVEVNSEALKAIHPCLTQFEEDNEKRESQYIHNLCDSAIVGYKYFEFSSPKCLSVEVRGDANGYFSFSTERFGKEVARIEVSNSSEWVILKTNFLVDLQGQKALYVTYKGQGSIDFKSITFA